ncbi:hypothetical protein SynA1562_02316 [Synechococcus sp. A15-62]|nr:hypothetical protein SynA1562_02316 [Synechococcus sp. A15-62]
MFSSTTKTCLRAGFFVPATLTSDQKKIQKTPLKKPGAGAPGALNVILEIGG